MLDTREAIKRAIKELIHEHDNIWNLLIEEDKVKETSKINIAALSYAYQSWYTRALVVVRQLLPDRLNEFEELYIRKQKAKELTVITYTISDFLLGLTVTIDRGMYKETAFDTRTAFMTKFDQQLAILQSAYSRVDSILSDITGALRADLFDSEIEKSHELLKTNYLRAAGTIASVVLESHLSQVCKNHGISFTKKILHISDYNDALKQCV